MREEAVLIGSNKSLVGVITDPEETEENRGKPAVLFLNAGIVHHVGPNRNYVAIARDAATKGHVALRFDFSGIGDSRTREDSLPFRKSSIEETQKAMDYLQATRNINKFILIGICSGGNASFRTACSDERVVGIIMINTRGHLHSDNDVLGASLRNRTLTRHYWRIAFFSSFRKKNWNKVFKGRISAKNILRMIGLPFSRLFEKKSPSNDRRTDKGKELRTLNGRGVRVLHIYSEGDEGIDYMHTVFGKRLESLAWNGILELETVLETNHTFTLLWSQERLFGIINNWLSSVSCD